MSRWWTGVALAALWLAPATATLAQYLPQDKAPPAPPEPVPFAGPAGPGSHPGGPGPGAIPVNHHRLRRATPPEPHDDLGLPASIPGAFSDCCPIEECACYFHAGGMALQRQRLGRSPIAYASETNLDVGRRGISLPQDVVPILDFNDLLPPMTWGGRATVGYLQGCHALELTGFYIPEDKQFIQVFGEGTINTFITTSVRGLEGNNGLFLQTDVLRTTLSTQLANAEANYRYFNRGIADAELILGVRYVDLQERVAIYSGDDDLTVRDIFEQPDPRRQGTFATRTHNRIAAAQFGFEWYRELFHVLSVGCWGKSAFGANIYDVNFKLTRGDGFVGRDARRSDVTFSHVYEAGGFVEFHILDRLRLRGGYNVFWVVHVPEAVDQIDFDLNQVTGRKNEDGSIFYHGPMVELQFLF